MKLSTVIDLITIAALIVTGLGCITLTLLPLAPAGCLPIGYAFIGYAMTMTGMLYPLLFKRKQP